MLSHPRLPDGYKKYLKKNSSAKDFYAGELKLAAKWSKKDETLWEKKLFGESIKKKIGKNW